MKQTNLAYYIRRSCLFFFLFGKIGLFAQTDTLEPILPAIDTALFSLDSLLIDSIGLDSMVLDSIPMDSASVAKRAQRSKQNDLLSKVKISDDGLPEKLDYSAKDTSIYDLQNNTVLLYGEAKVKYSDFNLEAGFISFNWKTNEVIAEGLKDQVSGDPQLPVFTDKNQQFEAEKIRFNFKSRKGIIENVVTKQGNDLYVVGKKAKISSVEKDSTRDDVVYSQDAIFTTCNHPNPHFGIRSRKQKVIPNKVIVVGPSNLELGGVPTPLWLPFGFYPITDTGSSGLIFPKDIENDQTLGFGLKGVGWFFPLGETANLQVTADYYIRGSFGLNLKTDYKKRYKYNGGFTLNFSSILQENDFAEEVRSNPLRLTWRHSQDAKSHPTRKFSGNINITTNKFDQQLRNDVNSVQRNQLTSSVSFVQNFREKPWRFTAAFTHSQNTATGSFNFTLPDLLFTTGNFRPFKSKGSKPVWYENFAFSYRAESKTTFVSSDSTLFTQETLMSANPGMKHTVTGSFNTALFEYFNFSVNTSFSENLYLKEYDRIFDPTPDTTHVYESLSPDSDPEFVRIDTTSYGSIQDTILNSFAAFHNLRPVNANLSFKVFSTMLFKKGYLRGLRTITTPTFGMSYTPGYANLFKTVDTDTRAEFNDPDEYTIFDRSPYDKPTTADSRMAMTYGFSGNVEAKVYSRKDKETRNIRIVESYSLNGNYNFRADSMQMSAATFRARTSFLKKAISINFGSVLNFYQFDTDLNKRVDKTLWSTEKRLFETTNTTLGVNGKTSIRKLIDAIERNEKPSKGEAGTLEALLENFSVNYNLGMKWDKPNGRDTFQLTTHAITINGNLDISEKWAIRIGQIGYNFIQKRLTYPDFTFTRDLHCWQMSVSWYPNANSFAFTLGVKPGTLDFIKVPYKRSNFEGRRF